MSILPCTIFFPSHFNSYEIGLILKSIGCLGFVAIKQCLPHSTLLNKEAVAEAWPLSGAQLAGADGGVTLAAVAMTTVCTFWVLRKPLGLPVLSSGVMRNEKHGGESDKASGSLVRDCQWNSSMQRTFCPNTACKS